GAAGAKVKRSDSMRIPTTTALAGVFILTASLATAAPVNLQKGAQAPNGMVDLVRKGGGGGGGGGAKGLGRGANAGAIRQSYRSGGGGGGKNFSRSNAGKSYKGGKGYRGGSWANNNNNRYRGYSGKNYNKGKYAGRGYDRGRYAYRYRRP